jgi:hypothetical protein
MRADTNMLTSTTLEALETLIIQAMRRNLDVGPDVWLPAESKVTFDKIETYMRLFIDLLRGQDPFAVKLRPLLDPKATLFEMQLLYAISEKRRGNDKTVAEVLNWWFPQTNVPEAQKILGGIATLLNKAGVKLHTSKQLKEKMLEASVTRPEQHYSPNYVNRDQHPVSKYLAAETFH